MKKIISTSPTSEKSLSMEKIEIHEEWHDKMPFFVNVLKHFADIHYPESVTLPNGTLLTRFIFKQSGDKILSEYYLDGIEGVMKIVERDVFGQSGDRFDVWVSDNADNRVETWLKMIIAEAEPMIPL